MSLASFCNCLCRNYWKHMLSQEWRWSLSSADKRCSSYIWMINSFIAHQCATCIRGFTVYHVSDAWIVSNLLLDAGYYPLTAMCTHSTLAVDEQFRDSRRCTSTPLCSQNVNWRFASCILVNFWKRGFARYLSCKFGLIHTEFRIRWYKLEI